MADNLFQIAPEVATALRAVETVVTSLIASAYRDSITSLLNGAALDKVEKVHDRTHAFGAVFVDLTGFKEINDRFGHDAGDAALSAAGNRISEIGLKLSAIPFRKSGDEFVLLTKNARDAKRCADAIAEVFGPGFFIKFEESELAVRGAVGFSVRQDNEATLKRLVEQADAACRHAKLDGGVRAAEWSPEVSCDDSVSIRKRCPLCQATTTLLVNRVRKHDSALSRCANCGEAYGDVAPEVQRNVA